MPEIAIRQQAGDLRFALALGRCNQSPHLLARRDAKRPDARLGLRRIIGEGEYRHVGLSRYRRHGCGFLRGQRSQDQSGAVGDGRLGGRGRATGRAAGVLGIQRRCPLIVQRKLRGMQHRLADIGACAREWQQDGNALSCRAGSRSAGLTGTQGKRRAAIAAVASRAIAVSARTGVEC